MPRFEVREGEELKAPRAAFLTLTVSGGPRSNPVGRRSNALALEGNAVRALATLLEESPQGREAWWSPHVWRGDKRSAKRWESSIAVVIEFDFKNEAGAHATTPPSLVEELLQAGPRLPGNILLLTPRGARSVFVLERSETDRALYRSAVAGAVISVASALNALGLSAERGGGGFEVDRAATDLARIFFTPRATVRGEKRQGVVQILHEGRYAVESLAGLIPKAPESLPPRPSQAHTRIGEAAKRWNEDHTQDFGAPGSCTCPACGHHGCFGRIPERPDKWTCFSSAHEATGCGRPGANAGWFGDALDLEAFSRSCSRAQVLQADGYLVPDARDRPKR